LGGLKKGGIPALPFAPRREWGMSFSDWDRDRGEDWWLGIESKLGGRKNEEVVSAKKKSASALSSSKAWGERVEVKRPKREMSDRRESSHR